ncbi:antibiotic biosynthesis monooxygenase family protein [Aeropyrum camini]|uniref:ABM domain-containing protein n=1 Tax=Aeropyrum camini SY1 = JCM 12091 TaxID=1198449 RepID=U3T9V0_9CREN|nr:antibiotic biosynthesis monooxygenase [Aeropyrum camini]BAN90312.1 hypothetical protein ACAM_0843 [Aeropyrum camini SY1 = JCM 12091]
MAYAIVNYIRAETPEAFEKVVESFRDRAGLVEGREGFRSLQVLANRERLEVVVITVWESKEYFEKWVESREFEEAHKRARRRRLAGTSSEGVEYEVLDFVCKG